MGNSFVRCMFGRILDTDDVEGFYKGWAHYLSPDDIIPATHFNKSPRICASLSEHYQDADIYFFYYGNTMETEKLKLACEMYPDFLEKIMDSRETLYQTDLAFIKYLFYEKNMSIYPYPSSMVSLDKMVFFCDIGYKLSLADLEWALVSKFVAESSTDEHSVSKSESSTVSELDENMRKIFFYAKKHIHTEDFKRLLSYIKNPNRPQELKYILTEAIIVGFPGVENFLEVKENFIFPFWNKDEYRKVSNQRGCHLRCNRHKHRNGHGHME